MNDSSDRPLLDLIRRQGPMTVAEMVDVLGVTPTAIRNRLTRLVGSGMVERRSESGHRGRPKHTYQASVEDRKLRRLLFGRVTDRLAEQYRGQVLGEGWEGRMVQLGTILHDRGIEAEVTKGAGGLLPVLRQHSCPYFALAEVDRAVCAMERKMFEKVLGRGLRLSQCRLDGHRSCDFEAKPIVEPRTA
jgi:predicted ArsR family transcriptional regulator